MCPWRDQPNIINRGQSHREHNWQAPACVYCEDDAVLRWAMAALWLGLQGTYGVEIKPLLVATTKRLPQRTIESTLPTLGTVCPSVTFQTPLGPSNTAVPLTTSRSVQPSIVAGLVSGVGVRCFVASSFTLAPVKVVCRGATVESLLASRDRGAVLTEVVEAEATFGFCGIAASAFRAISPTVVSCI